MFTRICRLCMLIIFAVLNHSVCHRRPASKRASRQVGSTGVEAKLSPCVVRLAVCFPDQDIYQFLCPCQRSTYSSTSHWGLFGLNESISDSLSLYSELLLKNVFLYHAEYAVAAWSASRVRLARSGPLYPFTEDSSLRGLTSSSCFVCLLMEAEEASGLLLGPRNLPGSSEIGELYTLLLMGHPDAAWSLQQPALECSHCGKEKGSEVAKLLQCSRCGERWYCGEY